ncbi:MAG TPA: dicarboxylate/amino acid:cation symporter, partial [Acidaminococcaceae bacterium]|nr:dicarboxylate/amino acid:cation symporter [Acidaminococcaceae bacterium]
MTNKEKSAQVDAKAKEIIEESRKQSNGKQFILWMAALVIGGALGWMNNPSLNELFNFIATIFTRMFQFIAVPTIALAVITTLSALGAKKDT